MSPLSNEQHITQDLLLRYVEDDCSRTEMREIDRHLATCSMCSDAVEGLLLLSQPSVAVAQLDKKIDAAIEEKKAEKSIEKSIKMPIEIPTQQPILKVVKRPFWQQGWAAAAAVLLLASGSIWVYNGAKAEKKAIASAEIQADPDAELGNNAVAMTLDSLNQTPQYADAKTAKREEIVADLTQSDRFVKTESAPLKPEVSGKTTNAINVPTLPKKSVPNSDIGANSDNISTTKVVPQAATSAPAAYSTHTDSTQAFAVVAAQKNKAQASSPPLSAKVKEAAKPEDSENVENNVVKKRSKAVVSSPAKAKKPMAEAKAAPSVSTTSDPILSRADDHYNNKNYEAAVADYTKFLAQETEGDNYDHAFFQLANCYLKLNKNNF
jgi:hypothetical protein